MRPPFRPFRKRHRPRPPDTPNGPVKLIFGLYQCLHHLAFLTGEGNTVRQPNRPRRRPFAYKVDELDRLIRPALPHVDSGFRKKCHEINEQWQKDQIQNLTDHYQYVESDLQNEIRTLGLPKSQLNGYIATARNWASNHFRRKFQQDVFRKVDEIVKSHASDARPPPKPTQAQRPSAPKASSNGKPTSATPAVAPKKATPAPTTSTAAPSTSTAPLTNPTPLVAPLPLAQVTNTPTTSAPATPSGRKGKRRLSLETSPSASQTPKKNRISLPEKTKSTENRPKPTHQRGVTRFPNLPPKTFGDKILEYWFIPEITKKIVVFGTSNLSRVTQIGRMDTQILSYPGLKLESFLRLLTNFEFGPGSQKPDHIIIAIGINDRGLTSSTNHVSLKKVVNMAIKKFPGCKISLYMNRYSPLLARKERDTLGDLNNRIEEQCETKNLNLVAPVPSKHFEVDPNDHSHIHWTEKCANLTISHMIDSAVKSDVHSNRSNNSPNRIPLN